MTTTAPASTAPADPGIITNRLALKIATVNGTGSASANSLLRQAIFRMGIPVSGKNLFPSNIQGLPTWYEIRVDRDGHTARTPIFDLFVAMNAATYDRDVAEVRSDGYILYDSTWPLDEKHHRPDVTLLGIPFSRLCVEAFAGGRERLLMKNIAYVGALAALLEIDREVLEELLRESYGAKPTLMESNNRALELGQAYAREHFDCPLPLHLERMPPLDNQILIDGNTAAALGFLYAGATVGAWYPITPSTSLMDAFRGFCHKYRRDPETGANRFMVIQAEDELAAAGMVIGAGWAGARAFTPTSGPGISLMSEFIGLAYYAEIPAVFVDVQRTGPSTGMPTRTQQGDLMLCAYASHGDTRHIVLIPADPGECFTMAADAFDLAERFQTPVFLLSDLDIGMNDWMVPRFEWDDARVPDRGKVLTASELEQIPQFFRYLDVDGDGIAARTLPGTHPAGAYFTRGSGHDRYGRYTEDAEGYVEVVDRIDRKIRGAVAVLPAPVVLTRPRARYALVTMGGCDRAVREASDLLAESGQTCDVMRIRAFPFSPAVEEFLNSHDTNFVVEQNRDGQLRSLLLLETGVERNRLVSVRRYGGLPMSACDVIDDVMATLSSRKET